MAIRSAAVAGIFYPEGRQQLQQQVDSYLVGNNSRAYTPQALVVPHAGYKYSAAIAANAYQLLKPHVQRIKRVVLLGPAHRVVRSARSRAARLSSSPSCDPN